MDDKSPEKEVVVHYHYNTYTTTIPEYKKTFIEKLYWVLLVMFVLMIMIGWVADKIEALEDE